MYLCFISLLLISSPVLAQRSKTPIMGWSSWNHFRIHIDEKMIREQADAMVKSGMYRAGYRFINIDDGYFGGRDANGKLIAHGQKFPSGMQSLAAYIHQKGLKAGIYTDAGANTCGSIWDKDTNGIGVGLYGHTQEDCRLFFKEWGYDFLKIDWCGGEAQKLNKQLTYTAILNAARAVDSNKILNICCWKFPGEWAPPIADSWRISGDIEPTFTSICKIIDLNARLAKYASPGHFNDMDMLQVGRGMTLDEDKSHFAMWCMLSSPLLAGNDLRNMTQQTIDILTNRELIALNQDKACQQATKIHHDGLVELWKKPLYSKKKPYFAVAIFNRSKQAAKYVLTPEKLAVSQRARLRNLWEHTNLGQLGSGQTFDVPPHGIVVLTIKE